MGIINVLNTCFTLCLAFAILFFVIAVVLFFIFDIRTIFSIRSGRAQAKTVKEMQEANSNTGRLRVGKQTQTAKLSPEQSKQRQVTSKLSKAKAPVPPPVAAPAQYEPAPVVNETQLLSQESAETEVLSSETSVLSESSYTPSQATTQPVVPDEEPANIYFEIVKKVICRGTDEVIR